MGLVKPSKKQLDFLSWEMGAFSILELGHFMKDIGIGTVR